MAKQRLNIPKGFFEVVNLQPPPPTPPPPPIEKKDDRQKDRNCSLFILLQNKIKIEKRKHYYNRGCTLELCKVKLYIIGLESKVNRCYKHDNNLVVIS